MAPLPLFKLTNLCFLDKSLFFLVWQSLPNPYVPPQEEWAAWPGGIWRYQALALGKVTSCLWVSDALPQTLQVLKTTLPNSGAKNIMGFTEWGEDRFLWLKHLSYFTFWLIEEAKSCICCVLKTLTLLRKESNMALQSTWARPRTGM